VFSGEVNLCGEAVVKASPNRVNELLGLDLKWSDLFMVRLKRG